MSHITRHLAMFTVFEGSQDGIVSIVTHYGQDTVGTESWWGQGFPCHPDWPWGHAVSCTMGTGSFTGLKCLQCGADHSPPSVRLQMGWSYTPRPLSVRTYHGVIFLPLKSVKAIWMYRELSWKWNPNTWQSDWLQIQSQTTSCIPVRMVTLHQLSVDAWSLHTICFHVLCVTGMTCFLFVNKSTTQHRGSLLWCKLLLSFVNMQCSLIQRMFMVEIYIRKEFCTSCCRTFRRQFPIV